MTTLMFGVFSRKKLILHRHWYVLIPDFQTSTKEFYAAIEADLEDRKVPNLETGRVEFPEGGSLSARREYLRMRRERLIFEVCASPFGTSWFFSCRFSEIPLKIKLWELLFILGILFGFFQLHVAIFDWFWGSLLFAANIVGLIFLLNSLVPMGLFDLDARLLRIPLFGRFYELFLRKQTYFRDDSRIMYVDLVDAIVREQVQEFTGSKNIQEIEFKQDPSPPELVSFGFFGRLFSAMFRSTLSTMERILTK